MTRDEKIARLQQRIMKLTEALEVVHRRETNILNDIVKYQKRLKVHLLFKPVNKSNQNTGETGRNGGIVELVEGYFERPYTSRYKPKKGHKVRILNPKASRKERGIIVGFCKNGQVKIDTEENLPLIIRSTHNITSYSTGAVSYTHLTLPTKA